MRNPRLLLVEDHVNGDNCCDLQRTHIEQMTSLEPVRQGRQQRYGGVIALGAVDSHRPLKRGSQKPRGAPPAASVTIKDRPIRNLGSIEAMLMTDKKGKHQPAWCFTAIASPFWEGEEVKIGEENVHRVHDFFKLPRRLSQVASGESTMAGMICNPLAGQMALRRVGFALDVCIGDYNNGHPAICFRFTNIRDFMPQGDEPPKARVNNVEPEAIAALKPGEVYSAGHVKQGSVIVRATSRVHFITADVNEEGTRADYFVDAFRADDRRHFRTALKMNELLSAGVGDIQRLSDLRTLVEFPREMAGRFVVGQFDCTPHLISDLMAALGPTGLIRGNKQIMLKIMADFTGRIRAVSNVGSAIVITYDDGREQLVSDSAKLMKLTGDGLRPLEAGMEVTYREPIGDFVDRMSMKETSFAELQLILGGSLASVLESMVTQCSVLDASVSQGFLVDYRYASPYISKSVKGNGAQKIYLDCSALTDLYDEDTQCILLPVSSHKYPLRDINSSSVHVSFLYNPTRHTVMHMKGGVDQDTEVTIEEGAEMEPETVAAE